MVRTQLAEWGRVQETLGRGWVMSRYRGWSILGALVLGLGGLLPVVDSRAFAKYIAVKTINVPVERVTANLIKEYNKDPKNLQVLINLARLHAMAYSQKSDEVIVKSEDGVTAWFGYEPKLVPFSGVKESKNAAAIKKATYHLYEALGFYRKAMELDPKDRKAQLGYGWLLSQTDQKEEAVKVLREVIRASWEEEKDLQFLGLGGHTFTVEGAAYLIPLLDATKDAEEIKRLKDRGELLKKLPRPITPIAIPLKDGLSASDIEDRTKGVLFDADGSGIKKNWTWIRPNAAWLVYRPDRSRKVESGLDLFGSVTFWLFWENGYDALASLDDNQDGQLKGRELSGLGIWQDVNKDGICQDHEFKTLPEAGIVSLNCRYQRDENHPEKIAFSPLGVTFKDGTVRSTFDLVLHPAK